MERITSGSVAALVLDTGYRAVVLDRLVRQTAFLLGAARACILVRSQGRHDEGIVAAAAGVDEHDVIGRVVELGGEPPDFMPDALWAELPPGSGARGRIVAAGAGVGDGAQALLDAQAQRVNAALDHAPIPRSMVKRILDETERLARSTEGGSPAATVELELAMAIAEELDLGGADRDEIELAVRLYPIGYMFKEGNGSTAPPAVKAARAAADAVVAVPGLEPLAAILLHVAENVERPGLPGSRIPIASRIVACSRAFRLATAGDPSSPYATAARFAPEAARRFGADVADAMKRALREPARH